MRRAILPFFLLALPLIEIAGFALVGREIGVLATIGLVLLSSIAGSVLLRIQGFGVVSRIQRDLQAGRNPGRELAHGVMILIAGILLIIPGFFTDIVGLLLFLPPIRDLGWNLVRDRVQIVGDFGVFRNAQSEQRGPVIDLDEDEFTRTSNPDTPWRQVDDR